MYHKFNNRQQTNIFCTPPPDSHLEPVYIGYYTESNLFKGKAMLLRSLVANGEDGGQRVKM